ncbi:Diacetylchitobiose uptake system permease protein NgcF [Paenibacillus auburnensis]|jgi:raffinose/stachyose/melibiose transport system permease protein|uniref:Diacetylchitobiose uptake system permease protein NgcF n=1 Tax=Paenibacillus auburnensis TaxID=2905649 RepID=A0ABN8GNX0_9BACL|nr:sugar ABC transporter permease [Paenibacillus auburnensis]CAH1208005.1 Diacetylchitobiose uptake system permease protein NgcF [Paenibacillus auburnensis]
MHAVFGNKKAIAVFVLPALILFILVGFIPIVQSFYYSMLDWNGIGEAKFVGLKWYKDLFVDDSYDMQFVHSIWNTFYLALLSVCLQIPFAFILAYILGRGVRGEKFYRTLFFIPVTISSAVIGLLFLSVLNPNYGVLNVFLDKVGLGSWQHDWLTEEKTALSGIMLPAVWQWIGYYMLLLYAAIKGISEEIFDAVKIDGASALRSMFSIVIPLISPIIKICIVFAVIGSLKFFDLTFIMTNGNPAPATDVPSTLMYATIFKRNMYGYGSAMAVFMVVECLVFYYILQRGFKSYEEGDS